MDLFEQTEEKKQPESTAPVTHPPEEKALHPEQKKFMAEVAEFERAEEKLEYAIKQMEAALSLRPNPDFRKFWEIRHCCLLLFRQVKVPAVIRADLWTRYVGLTEESYRLKDHLHKQSAFAADQIELAIKTIEDELAQFSIQCDRIPGIQIPEAAKSLERGKKTYISIQKDLTLLNDYAARTNALRKEILKTEIRRGHKHSLLQRLSKMGGEQVFSKRKDLIQKLSDLFSSDIKQFVEFHFPEGGIKGKHFVLREEIKSLQLVAKLLTINTPCFTECRVSLSRCWDRLKVAEKEWKSNLAEKKKLFSEHGKIMEAELAKFIEEKGGKDRLIELERKMRSLTLSHDDRKRFSQVLHSRRGEIENKKKNEVQIVKEKKIQRAKQETEKFDLLIEKLETVKDLEESKKSFKDLEKAIEGDFSPSQKEVLREKLFVSIHLTEKQKIQKNLSAIPSEQLENFLSEILEVRQKLKVEFDRLKKAEAASGMDLEQALAFNQRVKGAKERLEDFDETIETVEDKISEIEASP